METTPVLLVCPPTPRQLGTRTNKALDQASVERDWSTDGTNSNSLDTLGSSSQGSTQGRGSSENTAVNIYSMYSDGDTRDSSSIDDMDPKVAEQQQQRSSSTGGGASAVVGTRQTALDRIILELERPTTTFSVADSAKDSARGSVYETPGQSPIASATYVPQASSSTPLSSSSNGRKIDSPTDGQVIEQTSSPPAILINPPPRRSSKRSLVSLRGRDENEQGRLSSSSSPRPSTSAPAATLSPIFSPTRVPSEPATSATSSSGRSIPQNHLPSPLRLMAPSPGANEDPDSYFVRATYAAFDVSGVKGDGYEDGEEITRNRLGSGRNNLPSPIPDTATRIQMGPKELNEREVKLLEQVDRYGFYSPPSSENRLLLFPSQPLKVALSPYRATSSSVTATPPLLPSQPPLQESAVERKTENRRIAKWSRMLVPASRDSGANIAKWKFEERKRHKLEERVYKGIPDRWRAAAWYTLIEGMATVIATSPLPGKGKEREVLRQERLIAEYHDAIDLPSTFDIQIDLDVPRTISGHVMFKTRYGLGQRSMFHVLHSFSLHCESCGYCQGMGPLAATLLSYLEPERVYICLVRLHDDYDTHDIFLPGFSGLLEAFYVQEKVMQKMLPGVYAVFKQNMISTTAYAVKWYITLFANTLSYQTQLRLWDVYFLEGKDVLVLMAISILWVFKDNLLSKEASFESILNLLSSFYVMEDDDALMAWLRRAMSDRKLRRDMALWREEWKELVRTHQERDALL